MVRDRRIKYLFSRYCFVHRSSNPETRWPAGLFFEVPLLFFSRIIWKNVKVGKDGVDLSDEIEAVTEKAVVAVVSQLEDERMKSLPPPNNLGEVEPQIKSHDTVSNPNSNDLESLIRFDVMGDIEAEQNPVILFVRLRADIERELRRMGRLAGLLKLNDQPRSHRHLLAKLASNNLVNLQVYETLKDVMFLAAKVADRGVELNDFDVSLTARESRKVLQGLSSLPSLPSWVENAVYVRAQNADRSVLRSEVSSKDSVDFFVDTIPIIVKMRVDKAEIERAAATGSLLISVEVPRKERREFSLQSNAALAWTDGQGFFGTERAVQVAPWLFD